eukprot:Sspe_Gene.77580::Locus_48482_Transcript_1_1_Confidence_1.000_Length_1385::g.77580::m.77580
MLATSAFVGGEADSIARSDVKGDGGSRGGETDSRSARWYAFGRLSVCRSRFNPSMTSRRTPSLRRLSASCSTISVAGFMASLCCRRSSMMASKTCSLRRLSSSWSAVGACCLAPLSTISTRALSCRRAPSSSCCSTSSRSFPSSILRDNSSKVSRMARSRRRSSSISDFASSAWRVRSSITPIRHCSRCRASSISFATVLGWGDTERDFSRSSERARRSVDTCAACSSVFHNTRGASESRGSKLWGVATPRPSTHSSTTATNVTSRPFSSPSSTSGTRWVSLATCWLSFSSIAAPSITSIPTPRGRGGEGSTGSSCDMSHCF